MGTLIRNGLNLSPELFEMFFHDLAYPLDTLLTIITYLTNHNDLLMPLLYLCLESGENFGRLILVLRENATIFKCYPELQSFL